MFCGAIFIILKDLQSIAIESWIKALRFDSYLDPK